MAKSLKLTISLGSKLSTSPKLLSPSVFPKSDKQFNYEKESPERSDNFVTSLAQSQNCSPRNNIIIEVSSMENKQQSKSCLLINTPNKQLLLKSGIPKSRDSINVLGQGTFGTVIQGQYQAEKVAVKVTKLKSSDTLKESNILGICHENIVKVLEIFVKEKENYGLIVMEYFSCSVNLLLILNDNNIILNKCRKLQFARDVTKGIECCHRNGILHLDLKPSNILLCNNVCKICDFGNSQKITEINEFYNFQGSVAYAAPEILSGKQPTCKSDVYSLGILFWQIRCRRNPYSKKKEPEMSKEVIIYKVVKFNYRPEFEFYETDEFLDLSSNCWKQNPLHRPEALELLKLLNSLLCLIHFKFDEQDY